MEFDKESSEAIKTAIAVDCVDGLKIKPSLILVAVTETTDHYL